MPAPFLRRPAALALLGAALAAPALGSPQQFLPVGDPLEAELRVLDLYDPSPAGARFALPHLHARPVQLVELMGTGATAHGQGARGIALARLERALQRDGTEGFADGAAPHSTPRLFQRAWPGDQRVEVSSGLEGEGAWTDGPGEDRARLADGSGLHLRGALQVDRWLGFAHIFLGELRDVSSYSDALVANSDVAASTEESWIAYTAGTAWSLQAGRSRWHWGPGEEASLLLSKTSAPLSGAMLHLRIAPLRGDAFIFNATTQPGRGEQLAAHRLEWQPWDGVRVGVAEAARYHAGGWQGLYASGVVPYSLVQRLLDQDAHDSLGTVRNNVMISLDAAVRIADGSRAYGELLVDDLHAKTASVPNRIGWQAGWDGAGEIAGTRLTWNAEYTSLSRYVYTSFFGRSFAAQDRPLGFPTGPDARRLHLRAGWDPKPAWQLSAIATRTRKGENDLSDPFVPGTPVPDVLRLEGVVETSRTLEGEARWWPASGVDLSLRAGREWRENAGHLAGAIRDAWRGTLAVKLTR